MIIGDQTGKKTFRDQSYFSQRQSGNTMWLLKTSRRSGSRWFSISCRGFCYWTSHTFTNETHLQITNIYPPRFTIQTKDFQLQAKVFYHTIRLHIRHFTCQESSGPLTFAYFHKSLIQTFSQMSPFFKLRFMIHTYNFQLHGYVLYHIINQHIGLSWAVFLSDLFYKYDILICSTNVTF